MGGDHSLDAFTYMGMKIVPSPYVPEGKALVVDGKIYADAAADFLTRDWSTLTDEDLEAVRSASQGAVGREASQLLAERAAEEKRKQDELEATPGFGSF